MTQLVDKKTKVFDKKESEIEEEADEKTILKRLKTTFFERLSKVE